MRVSATLIARNESAFIEECLASLVGVVDEIVVVDTGSHDDTVKKAAHYPVKLSSFAWCDDFSAARNYALSRASGEWILYIDADERLEIPDRHLWDEVLADRAKVAWRVRFYPRVGWTPYAELRLFRNDPRIKFRGVIHESIYDSVNAVCQTDGREIGCCDIALQHVGYEGDQEHKLPRNVPLLEKYVRKDPGRVYCWWHLGDMLELSGDDDGAANAWRKGIEVARSQGRWELSNSLPFVSLIMLQLDLGCLDEKLLDEALKLFPQHLYLQWVNCQLALERGNGEKVRTQLETLASIDADSFYDQRVSYDKTLFTHACRESLALCHFRAGRFSEAAQWYRLAAPTAPNRRSCEIKAKLAEAKAAALCQSGGASKGILG